MLPEQLEDLAKMLHVLMHIFGKDEHIVQMDQYKLVEEGLKTSFMCL